MIQQGMGKSFAPESSEFLQVMHTITRLQYTASSFVWVMDASNVFRDNPLACVKSCKNVDLIHLPDFETGCHRLTNMLP